MFKSCFGLYISVFRNTLVAHKSLEKSCFTGFTVLKTLIQNRTKNLQKTLKALCFGGFFILEILKILQKRVDNFSEPLVDWVIGMGAN